MEKKLFALTIIATFIIAFGFALGRYTKPDPQEIIPCSQKFGKIVPFPELQLLKQKDD